MKVYNVIALMGQAGAGKDTILHEIISRHPDIFHEIISCTTRPAREGEKEGINYFFLSPNAFTEKVLNGEMLEATLFNSWGYGTMVSALDENKINIGVFNPEGIRCLMENPQILLQVFYVRADDRLRLIRQLNRESNPDIDEIIRRYNTDKQDFADLDDINYQVVTNNKIEDIDTIVDTIFGQK